MVELHVYKSGNRIVGAHGALPDERKTDSSRSIVEARSSAPTVATVEVVDGSEIRVLGLSPGRTDISVRVSGELNTESLTDIIAIDVASVAKVEIAHWLHEPKRGQLGKLSERWLGPDAVYLVGGEARFWIHAFDERDATLLGFGATPPVMVMPEGSATLSWTAQDLHHVSLRFHQPGAIDLLAKGSPTSRLTAVEPAQIEAISVQAVSPSALVAAENTRERVDNIPLRVDDTGVSVITARLKGGKAATLLAVAPKVSSKTPAICEPESPSTDARTQQVFGDSFVAVKLLSEGACRIEVHAAGHSIEHNFEVQPKH